MIKKAVFTRILPWTDHRPMRVIAEVYKFGKRISVTRPYYQGDGVDERYETIKALFDKLEMTSCDRPAVFIGTEYAGQGPNDSDVWLMKYDFEGGAK